MRKTVVVAIYSVLALGMIAPIAAVAAPPEPVENLEFDLVGVCPFVVHVSAQGKAKTIELPGGRTIFTSPGLYVTMTNMSTGKQEAFSATGSFHQTILENGDVVTEARGRNIVWQFESGEFESFLELFIGTFTYVFDADGNLKQTATGHGRRIDLCNLLE